MTGTGAGATSTAGDGSDINLNTSGGIVLCSAAPVAGPEIVLSSQPTAGLTSVAAKLPSVMYPSAAQVNHPSQNRHTPCCVWVALCGKVLTNNHVYTA